MFNATYGVRSRSIGLTFKLKLFHVALSLGCLWIGGALIGCDDETPHINDDVSGSVSGVEPHSNAGVRSGEDAGEEAGVIAGESAGVSSGEPAGVSAGEVAGEEPSELILRISPREAVLLIREGQAPPQQSFELTLVSARGESALDPSEARWQVNPGDLGAAIEGQFVSSGQAGSGQVLVEYVTPHSGETLITSASITVTAPQDVVEEGVSEEDVRAFDTAPRSPSCSPLSFIYPEPFTTIPLNLLGLTFQWSDAQRRGPYLITALAGDTPFRWFTPRDYLTPEGLIWESVKVSAPNGVSQWSLSYLTPSGERCDGPTLDLIVDRSQLTGAVYYWSTADAGIMRLAAGDPEPEPLLTPAVAPEINCPACHALSRDGTRIAFTRTTFPPFGDLATSLILDPQNLRYDPTGVEGYFPSFSPDPSVLVAGSSGRLVIRNSDTGVELEELPLPMGTVGGSPDWSWQGDRITAVVGPSGLVNPLPNVGISSGSIYEWTRRDDVWGAPSELIAPMGNTWNTNPAYSPDGTYIAYNVEGESPLAGDDAMGNPNVDLWIKRVGEASQPVRLDRANRGALQGNSWPKWSPHDRRGKLWLAFSSTRDYGHQLIQNVSSPTPQIWVTAIDLNAPEGQDPSSPAFWLPYQSLNSGNHIPYWAPYEKQ